jgi:ubiquinone/menaquinone biosynthesis C-methylase UbiE
LTGRCLSHERARAIYDRLGAGQDLQWYENRALDRLVREGHFGAARAVVEFGCGTGRLAARLLGEALPPGAVYVGVDQSRTMCRLAGDRLKACGGRAVVARTGGAPVLPVADGAADRFVCAYVLDLLSEEDARAALAEARRVLAPGGLACLCALTHGVGPLSKAVTALWSAVNRLNPAWTGGCRPLGLAPLLDPAAWEPVFREVMVAWGVPSEVVVARRRNDRS